MVPSLIESIKVAGLVLVTDTSEDENWPSGTGGSVSFSGSAGPHPPPPPPPPPSSVSYRMPEGVDGVLKGNGILRFHEMIDM